MSCSSKDELIRHWRFNKAIPVERSIMSEDKYKVVRLSTDLQNSYKSHNHLCKLAYTLQNSTNTNIIIDLSDINFIASNLFSVLGCIFSEFKEKKSGQDALRIRGMKPSILDTVQKNGFCEHIGLKKIPDIHNTVIPYKKFGVDEIEEYERYLTLNLFMRNDLPQMTKSVSDIIRDSLLELFKNVTDHTSSNYIYTCGQYFPKSSSLYDLPQMTKSVSDIIRDSLLELFKNVTDHTSSNYIYTCGQYFPKSSSLYFTIVDIGETIPYNVHNFHTDHNLSLPDNSLKWAIMEGNTTSRTNGPRGIGLSIIQDFISLNEGSLYIVSEQETYELAAKRERYKKLDYPFPGTIVTVGFNLNDTASYRFMSEENNTIQF